MNNNEFLSSLLHDIKSPMMSINMALQWRLAHGRDELLSEIYKINLANLNFVENMLQHYNFEDGQYHVVFKNVDLRQILDEQLLSHKYSLLDKGLTVITSGFDVLQKIASCPACIGRVFSNLISNAQKYAPHKTEIKIHAKPAKKGVIVRFINTVHENIVGGTDNIFKKFHTGNARHSLGLGLYICERAMERIGGEISSKLHKDKIIFSLCLKNNC
jgi:signal transduction histidine kinase